MSLLEIRITAPDTEVAERIVSALIERGLAACVQQLPAITSTYVWEGQVDRAQEILLLAKSTTTQFDSVCAAILALHPYDTPEILAVPVSDALPAYREWVETTVADTSDVRER